ncbi:MAG: hypothetical protein WCO65_02065 [bacterium]
MEVRKTVQKPEDGLFITNSKEALVFKKLQDKLITENRPLKMLEDEARVLINRIKIPGTNIDTIIASMKKSGHILPPPPVVTNIKAPVLAGFKENKDEVVTIQAKKVLEDEQKRKALRQQKLLEEENSVTELEKDVFKSPRELDLLYVQSLALNNLSSQEKPEYYYQFDNIVVGGRAQVEKDIKDLADREEDFKQKKSNLDPKYAANLEKNAKVATIVEQGLAYAVSDLGWYGENVKISPASRFDDVKRGIDDVLEISRKSETDRYLGLGIDVTYNGLFSEKYRDKFERLLESIRLGQKNKIKYFKNKKGEPMKEFAIPKIILHFDGSDVKEIAYFVKHSADSAVKENFTNSNMKISVLNQIMAQCEILADFANGCGNSIALEYKGVVDSINEFATKNKEIEKILENKENDETVKRLQYFVSKFKEIEMSAKT